MFNFIFRLQLWAQIELRREIVQNPPLSPHMCLTNFLTTTYSSSNEKKKNYWNKSNLWQRWRSDHKVLTILLLQSPSISLYAKGHIELEIGLRRRTWMQCLRKWKLRRRHIESTPSSCWMSSHLPRGLITQNLCKWSWG